MRYVISRDGSELNIWPTDDNPKDEETNPDHWLNFMVYNEQLDEGASVNVLASEIRNFVDWLDTWAPDARSARKQKEAKESKESKETKHA